MRNLIVAVISAAWLSAAVTGAAQAQAVTDHIYQAAYVYNIDADWMIRIARCESRLDPTITSRNGLYHGMYQYDWPTWYELSRQAGYTGWSPYNPEAAAQVTAYALRRGQAYRWPTCRYA